MTVLDLLVAECLTPLAVFLLISGLDDMVLILAWLAVWAKRRLQRGYSELPACESGRRSIPEKRIALFLPLWQEDRVIRQMLEHNVAAVRYRNYEVFAGLYPNDSRTQRAVKEAALRFPNVHPAVCPHPGPTSKGDCLNWIYQRMLLYEQERGIRFDAIVTHDAEDIIHPDALSWINDCLDRYDMVQVPVLPLPTPFGMLTHGVYCDEFAEYQTKDVPVRQAMGSFVPSNGVGTGYSRRAVEALAVSASNRIFEPGCLTEDYENGLRVHRMGLRQTFVPIRFSGGRPVATREYFPQRFRQAVRQRTRWIMGIALQTWERHGWRGSPAVVYWFWRDRKGLLGNLASMLGNVISVYGTSSWLWSRMTGTAWDFGNRLRDPDLRMILVLTLALQLAQVLFRVGCVARIYGARFALGVPLRTLWANWINSLATCLAIWRFSAARLRRRPLVWVKTEHNYPSREALRSHKRRLGEILVSSSYLTAEELDVALASQPAGARLGEHLVRLGLVTERDVYEALALQQSLPIQTVEARGIRRRPARFLPLRLVTRLRVVPYGVEAGRLIVAGPELPTDEVERRLRRHTNLEIRFELITPQDFEQLVRQLR